MRGLDSKLAIHIGYPKTATTFLQKAVFLDNIGGGVVTPAWNRRASSEVVDFIRGKRDGLSFDTGRFLRDNATVLSHENISLGGHGLIWNSSFRLTLGKMVGGLLDLESYLGRGFKILVTLRRQDTWLASAYVEAAPAFKNASQDDFEQRVSELLEGDSVQRKWLEFDYLVALLINNFGPESVKVLFQEDLKSYPCIWKECLGSFLDKDIPLEVFSNAGKRNVRQKGVDAWELRKGLGKITLSNSLSQMIMDSFREENGRLAEIINKDLGRLGYL